MTEKQALAQAAIETISMVCGQELAEGTSYSHKRTSIPNSIAVKLELSGDVVGYVLIRFSEDSAKRIASIMMMGMPIDELDDMSLSALSELGNMIMGGATVHLSEEGLSTDITTPVLLKGDVDVTNTVSVPLYNDDLRVVLDISVRKER